MSVTAKNQSTLEAVREEFIAHWGALGSSWGINRTRAQIHALLLVSPEPISTDQVMEALRVSRGNANTNLRELVAWGLVHSVVRKGERRQYFEAEKDVWKIFCFISRERKRREIDPAAAALSVCVEKTAHLKSVDARAFHEQMMAFQEFVRLAGSVLEKAAASEKSVILPRLLKL